MAISLQIAAAIARTEKAIKAEKDPEKLAALYGNLAAYKKTKSHIEKHETEEGDKGEDEEGDSEDDSEDSGDEDAAAKGDETVRTDADADESDAEEEDDEEESEEDEASSYEEEDEAAAKSAVLDTMSAASAAGITDPRARRAIKQAVRASVRKALANSRGARVYAVARKVTGKKTAGGIEAALRGMSTGLRDAKAQLSQATKDARKARRAELVSQALTERRITPAEAKTLRKQSLTFVEKTLAMRVAPIVFSEGGEGAPGQLGPASMFGASGAPLSADQRGIVDQLVAAAKRQGVNLDPEKIAADAAKRSNAPNGARTGKVI